MNDTRTNWFQTAHGREIVIDEPDPAVVDIEDIALALARICRFGGHLRPEVEHYSVAQHSLLVSRLVPDELRFAALLHDAAEAYMGDVIRPLKLFLHDYGVLEKRWEIAIGEHFGLGRALAEMHVFIKQADNIALNTERRDLLSDGPARRHLTGGLLPCRAQIVPCPVFVARDMFLDRYEELKP